MKFSSIGIGLAIFSMFFGAGNSIFPLYVGYVSQNHWYIALLGLILTAVLMPVLGIYAMLRAKGSPLLFFGRMGKIPGLFVALLVISLLGPLGSTPRCIALSYATLTEGNAISMPLFALLSCLLIYVCTLRKKYILPIIGYVLTPILLLSLACIIGIGIVSGSFESHHLSHGWSLFSFGLFEGYKTMDLLASFFFSSTILHLLKQPSDQKASRLLIQGGLIGGGLLAVVYGGFCFIAGMHAEALTGVSQEHLLKRLAEILLGSHASIIVRIAISVACLTTAIALITAFTDFLQTQVFKKKVPYSFLLLGSLIVTYFVSIFEFTQISRFLSPILEIIYPGLILLTIVNCRNVFLHRFIGNVLSNTRSNTQRK